MKTALLSWLVTILPVGLFVAVILPAQKQTFEENLESKARAVAASLQDVAASAVVTEDYSEVVDHCMGVLAGDRTIEFLVLTRNDGFSLIHTPSGWSNEQMSPVWYPVERTASSQMRNSTVVDVDVFKYSHPFDYSGIEWGWIHIGLSLDSYRANVREFYTRTAWLGGVCILMGLLISIRYARHIVNPILNLRNATRKVAEGDLNARAEVHSGDEVEALAHAFNAMTQAVQDREKRIRKQNQVLASLVTDPVMHDGEILAATNRITEMSAETIGVDRVGIWRFKDDRSGIECIDLFNNSRFFHTTGAQLDRYGHESYFGAMAQARTLSADDAVSDPRTACLAEDYLLPANISSVLNAPIRMRGRLVGVVCYEHVGPQRNWTLEDENFAGSIADLTALAFEARDRRAVQDELLSAKEAAETASKAKSRFLANMSHEIRTPLNGVVGMLKLLQEGELSDRQKRFVGKAILSSEALLMVINDVLDFSKIEAGKMEAEDRPLDLIEITENAVQIFAYRAEEKNLELACFINRNVPDGVCGDAVRIGQVLINLIGNSIKFTQQGEVIVRVYLESEHAESVIVGFEVSDTGIGISLSEKERIFEPFLQEDSSTTRRFGGTGLGLGICRQLVHLMGGCIHVESQPKVGSTFRFTVKLRKQAGVAAEPKRLNNMAGLRVLVVDDHSITREVLRYELSTWGCVSGEAGNGEDALALMREYAGENHPFDVVLVDWNMPGISGEELAERVCADPLLAGTPLILLSSISEVDGARLRAAGFTAWISKPARQSELYDAIVNSVNGISVPTVESRSLKRLRTELCPNVRVLLAEDHEINQEVASEILRASGCICEIVQNGQEAVDAVRAREYDLVLMDCMMPEMDGYEATRRIRENETGTNRRVPIIALTANAMKGDRERCLKCGMNDYLSKPLDPARTAEIVFKWTSKMGASEKPVLQEEAIDTGENIGLPLFNHEALLKRCMGNQDLVEELIAKFLDQAGEDLEVLDQALFAGELDGVIPAAHRIKGAASNLSMHSLSQGAGAVEAYARNNDSDNLAEGIRGLHAEIVRLREYFS